MKYDGSTPIRGEGITDAAHIDAWFRRFTADAAPVGDAIMAAHAASGVNQDFLAAEIAEETGYLTSAIFKDKKNPSGFGAVDGNPYAGATTFDTVQDGIFATAAHWCSYIYGDANPLADRDPRFQIMRTTPHFGKVSHIGQIGNGVWASDPDYASAVLNRMNDLVDGLAQTVPQEAPMAGFQFLDIRDKMTTNPNGGPNQRTSPKSGIIVHYNGPSLSDEQRTGYQQYLNDSYYHAFTEDWSPPNNSRGDGIMYHVGIELGGTAYQMRDWDAVLWHCASWPENGTYWAVSVQMGEGQHASAAQLATLYDVIETLRGWASIPRENVKGHQEVSQTACPGTLMDDFVLPYRAGTFVRPGGQPTVAPVVTPPAPANDPTNPPPLPVDAPTNNGGESTLRAKMVALAYQAAGQTQMGASCFIDDQQTGVYRNHTPAGWCEACAETLAAMATGERVRFASAEVHRQHAAANGYLKTDGDPTPGDFVFYSWPDDPNGHITVMVNNGNTIGTCLSPDAILELPLHRYTGYAGHCEPEAIVDAAKTLAPADPTGGGLGRRDPDGNRIFVWLKDPDTGKTVGLGGGFRDNWESEGGPNNAVIRLGLPLINERDAVNDLGKELTVQWCERTRLEFSKATGLVTRGRLGFEWLQYQKSIGATLPADVPANTDYIDNSVTTYWQTHGGLAVFGYPLTAFGPLPESTFEGQVFERCILEAHPADAAIGWGTQGRLIGQELMNLYRAGKIKISG